MEKKYVKAICKEHTFINGGSVINISILKTELDKLTPNEKGYVNLTLSSNKVKGKYGETHHIVINEFRADKYQSPDKPF